MVVAHRYSSAMEPTRIYDYLLKSRGLLFNAVRTLAAEQYLRPFPFGLKTIGATLTHVMISEWYYVERMAGRPVPPYEEWTIKEETPPPFDRLEAIWREQGLRVRGGVAAERDWARRITWLSFPDDRGRRFHITASAGDFFTQLVLHEVHHRSQVMVMLRELGHPLEDVDFNAMMFERIPAG
jgi:uncharacterized damage-inducible protein DinB